MATTSLWKVSGSLKKVLDYAENPDKTSLKNVILYTIPKEFFGTYKIELPESLKSHITDVVKKDLVKIIITDNGTTREIDVSNTDALQKVEIHRKRIDSTVVKFVYNITIKFFPICTHLLCNTFAPAVAASNISS